MTSSKNWPRKKITNLEAANITRIKHNIQSMTFLHLHQAGLDTSHTHVEYKPMRTAEIM